ncbi:hypothetical protein [Haliea sp. E17]|uniref:hypothetical protein n=1 Tax=Haliea sp. E17 TaxID=3401576 RepID=UPI003AAE3F01
MGLQASEWNQRRIDRNSGESYLQLICSELDRQSEIYERSIRNAEGQQAAVAAVDR